MLDTLQAIPTGSPLWVFVLLWFTTFGLLIGSYLNVVVYRLPRGISTVRPRSRCPGCNGEIRWFDNLPVLSWLRLRGRCRSCGTRISPRYPLVELATGALFTVSVLRFGLSPGAVLAAVFSSLLLALALIDVEYFLLPDKLTYPGILVGLATSWVSPITTPSQSAIGALAGAGILLAMIGGWYLIRREQGMGFGDVKMLAMMGAFLGFPGMVMALFFAALSGSVAGVALLAQSGGSMKLKLPFGVFLSLGALIALFAGEPILDWYLGSWR